MPVKPIPAGYHTVTPYVPVRSAAKLLDFLRQAFDAREHRRTVAPDGRITTVEVQVGDSMVIFAEVPDGQPGQPAQFYTHVPDTDATYKRALTAGGISLMEPADQYYGDRNAGVSDPSGNQWWIATRFEDVPQDELQRRETAKHTDRA